MVSQFPHDFNKPIQRIRPINSKLPILKHHEIPIIVPALCLPLAAWFELAFAVTVSRSSPLPGSCIRRQRPVKSKAEGLGDFVCEVVGVDGQTEITAAGGFVGGVGHNQILSIDAISLW